MEAPVAQTKNSKNLEKFPRSWKTFLRLCEASQKLEKFSKHRWNFLPDFAEILPRSGIFSLNPRFLFFHAAAPPCKKVAFFVQQRGFMPALASRESVPGYEPALSAPNLSAAQRAGPVGDRAPGA